MSSSEAPSEHRKSNAGFPLIGAVFIFLVLFIALCFAGVFASMFFDNSSMAALFGIGAWVGMALGTPTCVVIAIVIAIFAPNARI